MLIQQQIHVDNEKTKDIFCNFKIIHIVTHFRNKSNIRQRVYSKQIKMSYITAVRLLGKIDHAWTLPKWGRFRYPITYQYLFNFK